jgi:hypothetical protein
MASIYLLDAPKKYDRIMCMDALCTRADLCPLGEDAFRARSRALACAAVYSMGFMRSAKTAVAPS